MILKRLGLASLVIGLGIGAAGCTDGYGYSGVNVGYASGYGDGYYGDGYGGYGNGYGGNGYGGNGYYGAGYGGVGAGYFGWYGDYYYPGNGVYVYDRYRRPYRWNDGQRRYWEGRRGNYRGDRNWNGFDRSAYRGAYRNDGNRGDRGGYRGDGNRGYRDRTEATRGDRSGFRGRSNDAATSAPSATTRSFTPRTPRTGGEGRGWRGRSRPN